MTEVARIEEPKALTINMPQPGAIQVSREWETQIELVKKIVASENLSIEEFGVFCHVARVRHLDPLQRQIYAVKRDGKMTLQTGIDGFRAIAARTGLYMPSPKEPRIDGSGTADLSVTFFVLKWSPLDKQYHEFSATALYREFVQTKKVQDGPKSTSEPTFMWKKMPRNQLEKCAEAKALRRAWPEELGQMYVEEELPPMIEVAQTKTQEQHKTREVGTLRQSAEQNRGHGQEGMQRASASTTGSVNATSAASEEPKTSKQSKPTQRLVLNVLDVQLKTKKVTAAERKKAFDKRESEPQAKPYYLVKAKVPNTEGDGAFFVWHESLHEHAAKMLDCEIDVELSKNGEYYSLEAIHRIGSVQFVDSKPVDTTAEMPRNAGTAPLCKHKIDAVLCPDCNDAIEPPTGAELFNQQKDDE